MVGRLVAPVGFVSRMVGADSPGGWLSEWEDVVAMATGGEPVGRGLSGWRTVAVTMIVEMVFVGGCPSGWDVAVAMVAVACEGSSGGGLSVTTEECVVQLWSVVTMVPGGLPEGRT